jgi:hypothetical protein
LNRIVNVEVDIMAERVAALPKRDGRVARALKTLARLVNPLVLPLAGSGLVPVWGIVHRRGRRSGHRYDTPVAVLASPDGFLIPLPYGPGTDWCRNLRAAGGGGMRWMRGEYALSELTVVDVSEARASLGPIFRALIPKLGITQFVRARRSPA